MYNQAERREVAMTLLYEQLHIAQLRLGWLLWIVSLILGAGLITISRQTQMSYLWPVAVALIVLIQIFIVKKLVRREEKSSTEIWSQSDPLGLTCLMTMALSLGSLLAFDP